MNEKWYTRVLNTHGSCCVSVLFSRIFNSRKEAHTTHNDSSNCRYCQNEFSFYTIVIQLNNFNSNAANTKNSNGKTLDPVKIDDHLNEDDDDIKESIGKAQSQSPVKIKEYSSYSIANVREDDDTTDLANEDELLSDVKGISLASCNCKMCSEIQMHQPKLIRKELVDIKATDSCDEMSKSLKDESKRWLSFFLIKKRS